MFVQRHSDCLSNVQVSNRVLGTGSQDILSKPIKLDKLRLYDHMVRLANTHLP